MDTKHGVGALAVRSIIEVVQRGGATVPEVTRGLAFSPTQLSGLGRVSWESYAQLLEQTVQALGLEKTELMVEQTYHLTHAKARLLIASLLSPHLMWKAYSQANSWLFPMMEFEYQELAQNEGLFRMRLAPSERPCPLFFHMSTFANRGATRLIGLPSSEVKADIGPHHGTYLLAFPNAQLGKVGDVLEQLLLENGPWEEPRAEPAPGLWAMLSARQKQVATLLTAGWANKEIAAELSCSIGNIELHVTRLLRKSGARNRTHLVAALLRDAQQVQKQQL